jgi:hypothetical protein
LCNNHTTNISNYIHIREKEYNILTNVSILCQILIKKILLILNYRFWARPIWLNKRRSQYFFVPIRSSIILSINTFHSLQCSIILSDHNLWIVFLLFWGVQTGYSSPNCLFFLFLIFLFQYFVIIKNRENEDQYKNHFIFREVKCLHYRFQKLGLRLELVFPGKTMFRRIMYFIYNRIVVKFP